MTVRSKTRQTSAKRAIFLFTCALGILLALIVAVRHHRTEPLIQAESPEMLAKRTSPDNAWYALRDLVHGLPQPPSPASPGILTTLRGGLGPAFIATRLAIRLPDDDHKLLDYLEATRPAAETMPKILETQPFYWPPLESQQASRENLAAFKMLSRILCGHALYRARENRPDDAVRFVLTALQLGKSIASDGPFENVQVGCGLMSEAAVSAMSLPWGTYPAELGQAFLARVKALSAGDISLSSALDWELRMAEAGLYTMGSPSEPDGLTGNLQDAALRRFLRKYSKTLREADTTQFADLPAWSSRHERARLLEQKALPTQFTSFAAESVERRTHARTQVEGMTAVVALELYRQNHGEYPKALVDLTPDFLEAVPMDDYAAEPLRYAPKDHSYLMYSTGHVIGDDGGDPKRDLLLPPAIASAFASSLTNPRE
jgi:hypothetical protein